MDGDFKGLSVIELASVLAGPSVGMFFAELGAEVLKIENKKGGGDVTRTWKLPSENPDSSISAYYSSVNWHKKSLFLDLTDDADRELLYSKLGETDILIVNFKNGDAEKFELDYNLLKTKFPNLIYGEITGFGADSDRVAYDLILQAESGFMSMNGTPESGPVKMPIAMIDILAGHQLKTGLMTALYQRDFLKKGGCSVSVSLYDAALASLANQATNWLMAGHIPQRIGSLHPNIAPYGEIFETLDNQQITFAIGSDKQFKKLCAHLLLPQLTIDPSFESNGQRVKNRDKLAEILTKKIITLNSSDLISELNRDFVPVARIKNMKQVFESEDAKALILEEKIEGHETKRVKTLVFQIRR